MLRYAIALPFLFSLLPVAAQSNCEQLRGVIETRIRGNGIANPIVTVVPADAQAPGRVVGNCAKGTMKILYTQGPAGPLVAQPSQPSRPAQPVLTECADGRVITSGSCAKP